MQIYKLFFNPQNIFASFFILIAKIANIAICYKVLIINYICYSMAKIAICYKSLIIRYL